jgi:hypothetical protein
MASAPPQSRKMAFVDRTNNKKILVRFIKCIYANEVKNSLRTVIIVSEIISFVDRGRVNTVLKTGTVSTI